MSDGNKRRPTALSTIQPLPFWPNLKANLRSHGAALLLIYLEVHFPASQDSPNAPVLVDVDRTRSDLVLSPNAFHQASSRIGVCWRSVRQLRVARQVGREFFTRATLGAGALKPYSYLAISRDKWELRRNTQRLKNLLAECNMPYPIGPIGTCDGDYVDGGAFHVQSARSSIVSGASLAAEFDRSLAGLSDGRRKPGLRRKEHSRAPWSEERRAKFMATMEARYGWVPKNTAKHFDVCALDTDTR